MSYIIDDEVRRMLDGILPYFELNEVINVSKCIRRSVADDALKNIPVNTYSDNIKNFLVRYGFAKNLSGGAVIKAKGIALKNAGSLAVFEKNLQELHDYIVIDDDSLNNMLCRNVVRKVFPGAETQTFLDPNAGLRYLHWAYEQPGANNVVVLLDITMPTLMGWDVLDEISTFPDSIKGRFRIFMLTSSINRRDKERAISIPLLWGYLEKPFTESKLRAIFFV